MLRCVLGFPLALLLIVILLVLLLPDTSPGEFMLGVIVGLVTDAGVSLLLSLDEFRSSSAGYRVNNTVRATKEILERKKGGGSSSRLRDKYRYSLGVVIDNLGQEFADAPFNTDEWPCLIHQKQLQPLGDRWKFFRDYVRPVVEDLGGLSFLGRYSLAYCFCQSVRQLDALAKLCHRLEDVVCELDAAFGANNPLVELAKVNGKTVIQPINVSSEDIGQLREAYRNLREAWSKWLRAAGGR